MKVPTCTAASYILIVQDINIQASDIHGYHMAFSEEVTDVLDLVEKDGKQWTKTQMKALTHYNLPSIFSNLYAFHRL